MANPIDEQIVQKIAAALALITVANGYQVDVSEVYRPLTIGGYNRTPPGDYSISLISEDPVRNEELDFFGDPPRIGWDQGEEMFLNYRPSDENTTTAIETTLRIFWADVIKKLLATPTWDGLAIDTKVGAPTWFGDPANAVVGISAVITFQFRVKENDPYNQ